MLNSALLLAAAAAAIQQPASDAADRQQLEQLNAAWLKSYETRDSATLDAILAEDFIGLYGDSIVRRQQMLDGLAKRPPTRVKWDKLRISLNRDTAVVDAISTITTIRDDREASARYHYVDVYSKRARQWRAIASHVVRLPD
ncbi:MAG TPA: nuclear transport factor 2 family protein [Sphingomicrobium sp.]